MKPGSRSAHCDQEEIPMYINVSCNACGASDCRPLARLQSEVDGNEYQAVKCKQCGLVFAFPIPELAFRELSELYGMDYTESLHALEEDEEDRHTLYQATSRQMEMIESLIPKGRALNVGAMGSGSKVLLDRGWELNVVEVSEYAAETARQKWGMDVTVSRIEDVDYPAGYFDFIKLSHVIEHLADPGAVLQRLNAFMKDDGLVLIDTNNASGLKTRIEISVRRLLGERLAAYLVRKLTGKNLHKRYGHLTPPVHLYTFTPHSLMLLLERTGFRVIKLIGPPRGDPTWFPITCTNDLSLAERAFLLVDRIGARLGHGEVLVAFARKKAEARPLDAA